MSDHPRPAQALLYCLLLSVAPLAQSAPGTARSVDEPFAELQRRWSDPVTRAKRIPLRALDSGLGVVLLEDERALGDGARLAARLRAQLSAARVAEDGRVLVDILAAGEPSRLADALAARLPSISAQRGRLFSAWMTPAQIRAVAALSEVRLMRPAYVRTWGGLVTSQGDRALRADLARAASGANGAGVIVGTLSDSYDCRGEALGDVANGDLPPGVQVLREFCPNGSDEGRAMMQVIHDLAPGAGQAFHTAFEGTAGFANGIRDLFLLAGARVINDDVIYLAEPMFQDGPIAQAVDEVVAMGALYFSSAGNNSAQSYEAPYRDSGSAAPGYVSRHDFDPGPGITTLQPVTIPVGGTVTVVLQWDQPHFSASGAPGSASDVDIVLYNASATQVLASSIADNLGRDPVEIFEYTNPGPSTSFRLSIDLYAGPTPGVVKYVWFGSMGIGAFGTESSTVYGHANALGARAVGAVDYRATPAFGSLPFQPQGFSSRGGTPILFDTAGQAVSLLRAKPDLMATDGGDTTFFGFDVDGSGFPNFFGTSAAAPHAAAVAALLKSAQPGLPGPRLSAALLDSAIDMGAPGFDDRTGTGLLQADVALANLSAATSGAQLGFASLASGLPLTGSFDPAEFETLGATIAATGRSDGRVEVTAGPSSAAAGFSGQAARAGSSSGPATITLDFAPPVASVAFAFASPSGSVDIEVIGVDDSTLARSDYTGGAALNFDGVLLTGGQAEIVPGPLVKRIIVRNVGAERELRLDTLRFGAARLAAADDIDVPVPPWAFALLAALLVAGARRASGAPGHPA